MQSVCEENQRIENLSGSVSAQKDGWPRLRDRRIKRRQGCSCKIKPKSSHFGMAKNRKWKFTLETESISQHHTCPFFANSASAIVAKFRMRTCGTLLAGAIEASISVTKGAGGLSISPVFRCTRVVPLDNLAFQFLGVRIDENLRLRSTSELETFLDFIIDELELSFRSGKASPYDVDLEGNTLLHVREKLLTIGNH